MLDWTVLLAARSAHLAAVREAGRGPIVRFDVVHDTCPKWAELIVSDAVRVAMSDAGWMGLPPPVC